jgi:hypothetical protein
MGFFRFKPACAPPIDTDRIIPLHEFDNINETIVVEVTLRFDQHLDTELLRAALGRLLERKGWNKLGARLRKNVRLRHL